jgi:hypothetical protein
MSCFARPSALLLCLALVVPVQLGTPAPAEAQFKKRAAQLMFCGAGAVAGAKLGEKLAELDARRRQLTGAEAVKARRAFQVGMAVALCGTSALLAGTVYDKLSERDRKARAREMEAALDDASSTTRSYVLPDSRHEGQITAESVVDEGKRECRVTVDVLSKESEPARARYCRKKPDGAYELDI